MKLILLLLLANCLACGVFLAFPALDVATSRLFYDGATFPIEANRSVEAIRIALYATEDAAFLLTLALAFRRGRFLNLSARAWSFLMLTYLLGPGLLVAGFIKPIWDRPRPYQIAEFGGPAHFRPAWVMGIDCCGYRSFVSGEMAGATVLAISLTVILRANQARLGQSLYWTGLALALAVPVFTAWQRMAAGRHFLSDIVIAALLMGLLAATLHRMLGRPTGPEALLTSQPIPPISRLP